MKKLSVVILVLAILAIAIPVMAQENRAYDRFSETIRGENESCLTLQSLYVAKTFKDVVNLPIIGKANYRAEIRYTSDINSITNENTLMVSNGLEF